MSLVDQEIRQPGRRVFLRPGRSGHGRGGASGCHSSLTSKTSSSAITARSARFEAILKKYDLTGNPALVLLGKIVNGADTDNTLWNQPEALGLEAIAEGFRHLGYADDHAINAAEWIVYDALYAYCQEMVREGRLNGAFEA